jgi:hypothetical protein
MINMEEDSMLDRLFYQIAKTTHYCRDRHIPEGDAAALNFLGSQITMNPGESLEQLFDESRLDEAKRVLAGQPAVMDAANRLFNDHSYRQRMYRQYQEEIVPMLHPKGH